MSDERVVAYLREVTPGRGQVTDGADEVYGWYTVLSSWKLASYVGSTMYSVFATIKDQDGQYRNYHGRGFGHGMSILLRPYKDQAA